jgi:hypothetical protein
MNDLNEEVPESIVKFIGHVCGVIFLFLFALCILIMYRFFMNPKIAILFLLTPVILLTYFFGRIAIKFTGLVKTQIISKSGYIVFIIALFSSGVISLITAVLNFYYSNGEIINNIFLLFVSGICCTSALILKTSLKS